MKKIPSRGVTGAGKLGALLLELTCWSRYVSCLTFLDFLATNNVSKEGELEKDQVCAKFAHTANDGKTYQVVHNNLDVIISVGYRVKSQRGTQFRIWATSILKDHLGLTQK